MTELEDVVFSIKESTKIIVESGEQCIPVIFAISPKEVTIVAFTELNKESFKRDIGELLRRLDAHAYVFINEAWSTRLEMNSPTLKRIYSGQVSVSDLPPDDKQEILAMTVVENGKLVSGWSARIEYSRGGERRLGEWEKLKGVASGRLILKEW